MEKRKSLTQLSLLALPILLGTWAYQRFYLQSHLAVGAPSQSSPPTLPVSQPEQSAITQLENAVTQAPQDVAKRWQLADTFQKIGQLEGAKKQLQTIVALRPKDSAGHLALANLHTALGEINEAEQNYRTCLRLSVKSSEAWLGLASTLYHQNRFFEALEAARRGSVLAPDDPNGSIILASTALDFATQFPDPHKTKSQELALAKRHFLKAVTKWPNQGQLHLRLGTTNLALGDAPSAIKNLRRARELMPDQATPVIMLGRAFIKARQRDGAKKHVEGAVLQFPDNAELHNMLSILWRGSNEAQGRQKSYEFIRKAVELEPDNAEYQETLGLAALRVQKTEEARLAFERSLKLNPYGRVPYLQLAAINNQLGQAKSATAYAKKSTENNARESELRKLENLAAAFPQNAAVRATLASWYATRGFLPAARDTYLQALRLDPKNQRIKKRLLEVQSKIKSASAPKSVAVS